MDEIYLTKGHELSLPGIIRVTIWENGKSGYIIDIDHNNVLRFVPTNPSEIVDLPREKELAQPVIARGFVVHWLWNRNNNTRATYEGFYSACKDYYFEINRNRTLYEIEKLEECFPQLHYDSCLADYKLSNTILPFLSKEEQRDLISHAMDYLYWLKRNFKRIVKGNEGECFGVNFNSCNVKEGNMQKASSRGRISYPFEHYVLDSSKLPVVDQMVKGMKGACVADIIKAAVKAGVFRSKVPYPILKERYPEMGGKTAYNDAYKKNSVEATIDNLVKKITTT